MGLELTINLNLTIFSRETERIVKSRSYCNLGYYCTYIIDTYIHNCTTLLVIPTNTEASVFVGYT